MNNFGKIGEKIENLVKIGENVKICKNWRKNVKMNIKKNLLKITNWFKKCNTCCM